MFRILVTGLLPHDSGKTWASAIFLHALRSNNINAAYVKPIGATELWRDYKYYMESLKRGVIVSGDALKIASIAKDLGNIIEIVNPAGFYTIPLDPQNYRWKVRDYLDDSQIVSNVIFIGRLTNCKYSKPESVHILVKDNLLNTTPVLRQFIRQTLEHIRPQPVVISRGELVPILVDEAPVAADTCIDFLEKKYEALVIESYNNVSTPTMGSLNATIVAVVAPGRINLYRGEDYRRAINFFSPWRKTGSLLVGDIVKLIKPIHSIETLPVKDPLSLDESHKELIDKVSSILVRHAILT